MAQKREVCYNIILEDQGRRGKAAGKGSGITGVETRKENKMGTLPVRRLLITMSLPMMISMLVQALYNVVDSIYVAQLSENALAAVTYAFPIQHLLIAVGSGTGVGVNAMLSKALGERKYERANDAAAMGLLLSVFSALLAMAFGIFLAEPFLRSQTAEMSIVRDGAAYLRICCTLSLGLFLQVMGERLLQSTGRTTYSMISQLTGALVNIILDPIMIFGLLGCPAMGISGAAVATVIGQFCAAGTALWLNVKKNEDIRLSLAAVFRPRWAVIGRIYAVGVPSILMMSIGSLMTYLMNRILTAFSTTAAAVFGVYFKLQSFFFMPLFGMNNGLIPILAFNYGARDRARVEQTLRFAILLAVGIMTAGTAIFCLLPDLLLDMFNASDAMRAIGVPALRIIGLHFPVAAVCIALGSTFQAFSRSIYSLIVSVMRQLVVLIPCAWLLAQTGVVTNVWWAFPIAEIMSLTVTLLCYRRLRREVITKL